ncbi:FG-GAP-like repeat-containing protein [Sphingorhabdus sp. YGSMI21]|uniref:FG-GAP-like repeat-containing protein n=1 Tax=Sphingorhabdus sp. YGSMI21 TaxID=2077182 RepID=UPI000C1F316B|nr:FG-GAP-like repeat-containing protein [Sphingorhabdus sp. YGSMI21]ATW03544.1 hypothetical protein CHN51_08365 [Sphingorhabdus sp. YGSMI21]
MKISSPETTGRDSRLAIALLAMAGLAITFWTGSRYPALNSKAAMGGDTPLSGLAFDIVYDIFPDSALWWTLVANTANWIVTNIKGMTFGILFGAALLTLLSLLRRRQLKGSFGNAALGAAIGAPLGVCVNCAMPIAVGLHMGRMRLETTLAAMMASPTLNVIVVSMTFALLPLHMAVIKLVLALLLVLVAVPLLCRFLLRGETERTRSDFGAIAPVAEPTGVTGWLARRLTPKDAGPQPAGLLGALVWYLRNFLGNLFTISILTVPMMFAAALLGALIASFFDTNAIAGILPRGGMLMVPLAMIAVALVAAFVPAPIALDVILTIVLLNIGLTSSYATVALIALGSTSIYAVIVLWRVISRRTALVMFGAVIAMAVTGGILAHFAGPVEARYEREQVLAGVADLGPIALPQAPPAPAALPMGELSRRSAAMRLAREPLPGQITSSNGSTITTSRLLYPAAPQSPVGRDSGATIFTRLSGRALGLAEEGTTTPLFEIDTYMFGGAIAAGDVDGDGWDDVLVRRPTGGTGLSLYRNLGGRFARQDVYLGKYAASEFLDVAFADWNGDGMLDLIGSTRMGEVLIIPNDDGQFALSNAGAFVLHLPERVRALTLAFADFDRDSRLDMAIGGWASGTGRESIRSGQAIDAKVFMVWNDGPGTPELTPLPVTPGQTLTLLAHDFDGNGYPDLLKGDDVAGTDELLFFGPGRQTLPNGAATQPFPYLLRTSMSYDLGDWNNDLVADVYGVQISDRNLRDRDDARMGARHFEICSQAAADLGWNSDDIRQCSNEMRSIDQIRENGQGAKFKCRQLMSDRDSSVCAAMAYLNQLEIDLQKNQGTSAKQAVRLCHTKLAETPALQYMCAGLNLNRSSQLKGELLAARHVPMVMNGNMLFTGSADGRFRDQAEAQKVRMPGWGWNSRFADLDQDGLQDLLVMTGVWLSPGRSTPNIFYRNDQGRFKNATDSSGLGDIAPSYSYALTDFDRDGDIDVLRPPESLSMVVHRNDRPAGQALWIRLRDTIGNSMGVGAMVTICTGGTTDIRPGPCQRRWVRASGGYMSFDPIAAHFGLGSGKTVSLVEVKWPDGEVTRITPAKLRSGELLIERSAAR